MSVTTYLSTSCQVLSICILHLVIMNNIEQWRIDSALWHFFKGRERVGLGSSAFESQWHQWTVKRSLCALAVFMGGSICLWCLYLYICTGILYIVRFTWCHTDISLYLPISWLFRMGSHWLHWKAKSSLWALAVSKGGVPGRVLHRQTH